MLSHSVVSDSCDRIDCSPPGSSVHGILQAIILEWVAISFSRGSSQPRNRTRVSCITGRFFSYKGSRPLFFIGKHKKKVKVKSLSHVQLFATPWTVAYEAPPSMGFSRQECWSGLPFPSPGDRPNPGIEPGSPALKADLIYEGSPNSLVAMLIY